MSERAVSEVVSYVLVFGLIVSAVGIVSVSGLATLQDVRTGEQMENAERAFDVLADNIADVHRRDAPSRATEFSLSRASLGTGDNVTMRVSVTDSTGTWQDSWTTRPIVYRGDEGGRLTYEAGAVFRTSNGGGLRVTDPPFVVSEDRVHLSVVGLTQPDTQRFSGGTVLVRTNLRSNTVEYGNTANDVDSVSVQVLGSQRTDLWREYFTDAGFSCSSVTDGIECTFAPSGSIDQVYVVHHDIDVEIES